uniref:Uncharacterized protein n=1 Tax=viral metagenome TaxID=1070528 RepID=A0A6C0C2Y1_9ZZZZ
MESAYLMLVYFSNEKKNEKKNEKTRTKKIITEKTIQYPSLMSFSSQASTVIT